MKNECTITNNTIVMNVGSNRPFNLYNSSTNNFTGNHSMNENKLTLRLRSIIRQTKISTVNVNQFN